MKKLMLYFKLMRSNQWVKNGFVFMPIIFGGLFFNTHKLISTSLLFGVFCILSSGVYIINDIKDLYADRLHPRKKHRPLAEGSIKIPEALALSITLLCLSLISGFMMGKQILLIILLYLTLNILYSFFLKNTVILDVISISIGFELRVWAGSIILGILPSIWLQLCVFLLALFLGFIKRRHERLLLYDKAVEHRGVLAHYTAYFLDQMIMISATLCIVFYGLYALSEDMIKRLGGINIAYTIPFVVYGIFRYLYLVHVRKVGGDSSEILMSDLPFVLNLLLWVSSIVFVLYFWK